MKFTICNPDGRKLYIDKKTRCMYVDNSAPYICFGGKPRFAAEYTAQKREAAEATLKRVEEAGWIGFEIIEAEEG